MAGAGTANTPLPTMLEYQEAVQHPKMCFGDAELAGGAVVLDALGLPKPISGGFASVYQVKTAKKHYAVRCFLRTHAEVQTRYAQIATFQRKNKPKWMADFDFIAQGIKVRGTWYPVLKMEWVQGEQLNTYVEGIIGKPKQLVALAEKFQQLIRQMGDLGVAHGDLQHGNILVAGGELKLIDYDAMFVPGMKGKSHEVGHRNFQHPKRSELDFGAELDAFSAWVILLSLKALVLEPKLWQELAGGDEGLLLRKEDFVKPAGSKALAAMERVGDKELKEGVAYFRAALAGTVAGVISPMVYSLAPAPVATSTMTSTVTSIVTSTGASTGAGALTSASTSATTSTAATSGRQMLAAPVAPERIALAMAVVAAAGGALAVSQQMAPLDYTMFGVGGVAAAAIAFVAMRYATLPQVRQLRKLYGEHRKLSAKLLRSQFRAAALVQVDDSFKTAKRLDFAALFAKIDSPEGQEVLASIMEFLRAQSLATANLTDISPDLGRKLSRRGLKNALRLADVVVSRSLADDGGAERVALVLQNGHSLEEPAVTRPQAQALLAWRNALERQFVATQVDEERLRHDDLDRQRLATEQAIDELSEVNGWRFVGRILGIA